MNNLMINALGVVKEDVNKSLEIMGYGVLAIFIVIVLLIAIVALMQYIEKKGAARRAQPDYVGLGDRAKVKFDEFKEKLASKKKTSDEQPPDSDETNQ